MQDPDDIRRRKRRSTKAVLAGLSLMGVALLVSVLRLLPDAVTTLAAILGFSLVMYGVHTSWVIFYERESDGPPT
jgi:Na+/phosphate symporter